MDKNILKEYARLIAVSGVNVQPGQEVVVRTEPESLDFLETLTEELYLAGAGKALVIRRSRVFRIFNLIYCGCHFKSSPRSLSAASAVASASIIRSMSPSTTVSSE